MEAMLQKHYKYDEILILAVFLTKEFNKLINNHIFKIEIK